MSDKEYDVVAIGRPYTDIRIEIAEELLESYGFLKGEIREIRSAQMELLRDVLFPRDGLKFSSMMAGGSPPNTCADVQALGG